MRAGTENVYGIVGFARALELATQHYQEDRSHIEGIKKYTHRQMLEKISGVGFNGDPEGESLYTVLSVSFPKTERAEMLLLNLDIHGICASGGSACTSGADQGSHVIRAFNNDPNRITVRFSFSKMNTTADIDLTVKAINDALQ
jgi:cysteine desulfurase